MKERALSDALATRAPGTVVLVVGASGVGKDTMLAGAAAQLPGCPHIVFVRRCVTRPNHASEAFQPLSPEAFAIARASGAFALTWEAHGLSYGIPSTIDADVTAGRVIVINASRGIVRTARRKYARTCVVLVECAADSLRARLVARRRETMAEIEARLARASGDFERRDADVVIDTSGPPEVAAATFAQLLRRISAAQPAPAESSS